MSNVRTFALSQYHDSVLKVREFMFNDIEKTLSFADNLQIGAPNFLLALGLCCYTEYWGKLLKGIKKSNRTNSKKAFNGFLRRLDPIYYGTIVDCNVDLYGEVRCDLAHAYLIEAEAQINTGYKGSTE